MKNILAENMLRFGTKNLSEQFLKNLANKVKDKIGDVKDDVKDKIGDVKDDVKDKIEHINACKGVTATNPPAHFKTKYVNNATTLYFFGVFAHDGGMVSREDRYTESDLVRNILKSMVSDEAPKPYGIDVYKRPVTNAAGRYIHDSIKWSVPLTDKVACRAETGDIIIWIVKKFPISFYDNLKKIIFNSKNLPNKTEEPNPAATTPTASTPTTTSVAAKTVPAATTTPASAPAPANPTTTPATTSATPTTTSVPTKATHMYPNDRNYLYAKDAAGKWWAQNKKTSKWFDISTKYPGSVANLEKGAKPIQ